MLSEIKALYHDGILAEAAKRYGLAVEQITFVKDMESFVYEFEQNGKPYILKITHTLRRTPEYIMGEIDWLNYLGDRGLTICRAVPSVSGQFVEQIPGDEGTFLAIAYEKAPGQQVNAEDWNAELFHKWGRYIGRMHALTKDYQVSNLEYKRQEGDHEDRLSFFEYIPAEQTLVLERADQLFARLNELPRDRDSYGMVHDDLHNGNFFYHEGELYAFDFDDISYNWFIKDIATVLYFVQWFPAVPYDDKSTFAREFLHSFLSGYREENELDPKWLELIPDFLRLQHMVLYGLFHEFMDMDNLQPDEAKMIAEYREDIEQETPIIDLDFTIFADLLAVDSRA